MLMVGPRYAAKYGALEQLVVACQQNEIAARAFEREADGAVALGRVREGTPLEDEAGDGVAVRNSERANAGTVRDDERWLDAGQASIVVGVEHRFKVRASPGDQDAEAHRGRLR